MARGALISRSPWLILGAGTKPCGRQGLVQVSQRERAQMEPCNPKICTRWAIWRRARQRWLTLLVGFGKRRFEKGFPGWELGPAKGNECFAAVCVKRRHPPLHETNVFTSRRELPHKVMHRCSYARL